MPRRGVPAPTPGHPAPDGGRPLTAPTRTLGLDLAKTTGAVVTRPDRSVVWKTTFTTHAENEAGQCLEIRDLVDRAIREYGPFAVVGIEDTWLGRNVGLLKHLARLSGAVLVALSDHDQPYLFVPPNRARRVLRVPYTKAEAHAVLRARRSVPRDLGADELDAWVVAVAAYRFAKRYGLLDGSGTGRPPVAPKKDRRSSDHRSKDHGAKETARAR